jgi:hypothetical protein
MGFEPPLDRVAPGSAGVVAVAGVVLFEENGGRSDQFIENLLALPRG